MRQWLTYPQAARRVGRSVRTLQLWRAAGMPVAIVDEQVRIDPDVLAAWDRRMRFLNPKRTRRAA